MLSAIRVGKAFGDVRVLDDVSFDLRAGEVHVLAGENGAGKSTLIKILAGLYPEHDGTVARDASAGPISVIHQELSLVDSMSVEDNIHLGREHRHGPLLDRREQRRRARELCKLLDLDVDLSRPVGDFPMSVKNRIEIAKALSVNSRILIMDEPTSALTQPECEKFFELIAALRRRGCGIVYISHKMDEIYRLADRITVLRDGAWVGTADACSLPENEFVHWMIGRQLTEQYPARSAKPGNVALEVNDLAVPGLVDGVSLDVRAGEIVGVAGLQGAGNTELFNALFGVYGRPARGRARLEGRELSLSSPRASLREGVAYLTNDRKDSGLVTGMSVADNITLAALRNFSRGGWLVRGAETYAAQKHGMAILLISTEMPELLALSDRVLVMHRGRLTAGFSRERATQEKILRAAMGEFAA
ncbi:MAG: sugar ABC transporter ATP-binding protein [Deltaproteobacteria bacterium]|nr:sugar ABC transporter ATP-binding protein [Deltaproteobacteria bacterium]